MTVPERSILQLTGADGTAEFDVSPDNQHFQMTVGKEKRKFKIVDLYAMVFNIVDPEKQEAMIPVRQSEVVTYKRIHNVMLKKNMKKGEKLRVKCEINVEKTVVEALRGLLPEKKVISTGVPLIGVH